MNIRIGLLLLCLAFGFNLKAQKLPTKFDGKIVGIKDGDTYIVLYNKQEITIRLEHIDCPEGGQAYGKNAKRYASDLCFGKKVRIEGSKYDRYKRLIAVIYVGDTCINQAMVKGGYAWHFKKYSKDMVYDSLQMNAERRKIGLWGDINPLSPWEWRANRKSKNKF